MERWKKDLVGWLLTVVKGLLVKQAVEPETDYERQLSDLRGLLGTMDLHRYEVVEPPWLVPSAALFDRVDVRFDAVMSMLTQVNTTVQQAFRIEHASRECASGKSGAIKGLVENNELKLVCTDAPAGTSDEEWTVDHILKQTHS